ncbi:MAG: hypothetical protein EPN25_08125 [Nitrospirae bacterium]|nr:MAG: hypothetical protein EPN25_08125 [Nitrospirota bacterium]
MKTFNTGKFIALLCCIIPGLFVPGISVSAEKKPPAALYWISAATENQSIPGMSEEMSGSGGLFGKMAGMPQMGPRKTLRLQLNSPRPLPADPEAQHDIPPGQNMGKMLPLQVPVREKAAREYDERQQQTEKPKARMLIYWGCGETVGKGQPRVLDTSSMSLTEFGKAMSGRGLSPQYPPSVRSGWVYSEWPNQMNSAQVPRDSELQGNHFVHGNYVPDIKFGVGQGHDFMAPVEFSSIRGGLADSMKFTWKKVPTSTGYFAQAMGHNEKTGEMIFWTSSEVSDTGFGLLDYLTPADVRRFIKEKVVMSPETTGCAIPKGIFKEAQGAMLQFIGYGDELNITYPPKPKDPKAEWNPVWTVKLRLKSTGFTPLGGDDESASRRPARQKRDRSEEQGEVKEQDRERKEEGGGLKKIKGLFGF